jgi:hypothetical protein
MKNWLGNVFIKTTRILGFQPIFPASIWPSNTTSAETAHALSIGICSARKVVRMFPVSWSGFELLTDLSAATQAVRTLKPDGEPVLLLALLLPELAA